jgi:hypothetical protein
METEKLKQVFRELRASIEYYDELISGKQSTRTGMKDAELKLKFAKQKILTSCMNAENLLK